MWKLAKVPDFNGWIHKLIHSGKIRESQQNKVVTDGRKSPVDDDVVPPKYETVAEPQEDDPANNAMDQFDRVPQVLSYVTPSNLRSLIESNLQKPSNQSMGPTQHMLIRGERDGIRAKPLSARKVKDLGKACPSLRQLAIEDVNLRPPKHTQRVRMAHFASTLSLISIRDSVIENGKFFKSSRDFYNVKVLDLGGSLDARQLRVSWPPMANLEELYLEGIQGVRCVDFLKTILVNCPVLKVLDLEGTEAGFDALELLSTFAPQLETLFLGFTRIQDSNLHQMEISKMAFRRLSTLCLADTAVTDYGLRRIRAVAPNLRNVTVNGFNVTPSNGAQDVFLPLKVRRTCNVHIGAVFRNQGCDHFKQAHSQMS